MHELDFYGAAGSCASVRGTSYGRHFLLTSISLLLLLLIGISAYRTLKISLPSTGKN